MSLRSPRFWKLAGLLSLLALHFLTRYAAGDAIPLSSRNEGMYPRDYLASLHIRVFDFICHPYRKTDLERILQATLSERAHAARLL